MNVQEFLNVFGTAIVQFFSDFIPNYVIKNIQILVQVIALFVVAYIIGKIAKAITIKLLSVVGFKRITIRSWTDDILKAVGYRGTIVGLIGDLVKWFIYIIFLGAIINIIGFPGLTGMFNQIAIFVPRFIVAILTIVVGFLIADFLGKIFEEAGRRFFVDEALGMLSGVFIKYTIAMISIIMSLSLMGLDTLSLTVMFSVAILGATAIFILALRDTLPDFAASLHLRKELKIGESVKIGEKSGTVEKINPTTVTLKNGAKRIIIPSSFFARNMFEKHETKHKSR